MPLCMNNNNIQVALMTPGRRRSISNWDKRPMLLCMNNNNRLDILVATQVYNLQIFLLLMEHLMALIILKVDQLKS